MSHSLKQDSEISEISEVNVVPLADVSLVLLIILMVLSPMMVQSMLMVKTAAQAKLDDKDPLPPPAPKPDKQEMILAVTLRPDGVIVGDKAFNSMAKFMAYMAVTINGRTDKKVFLTPHPDVMNGTVVKMIEVLKNCGAESVALVQTQDDESPAANTLPDGGRDAQLPASTAPPPPVAQPRAAGDPNVP